jgi:hypothetical protein
MGGSCLVELTNDRMNNSGSFDRVFQCQHRRCDAECRNRHREFQDAAHGSDVSFRKCLNVRVAYPSLIRLNDSAWNQSTLEHFRVYVTSDMATHHATEPLDPCTETLADTDETFDWTQFVCPADFWPLEQWQDGPVIAAAGLEDSTKLREFIDRSYYLDDKEVWQDAVVNQANHFNTSTTVLRAIERLRGENLGLLLHEGANPNGVPMSEQIAMARRFRRFCYEDPETDESVAIRWGMEDVEIYPSDEEIGSVPS